MLLASLAVRSPALRGGPLMGAIVDAHVGAQRQPKTRGGRRRTVLAQDCDRADPRLVARCWAATPRPRPQMLTTSCVCWHPMARGGTCNAQGLRLSGNGWATSLPSQADIQPLRAALRHMGHGGAPGASNQFAQVLQGHEARHALCRCVACSRRAENAATPSRGRARGQRCFGVRTATTI